MAKKKIYNQDLAIAFLEQEEYARDLIFCVQYNSFYIYRDPGYYELLSNEDITGHIYSYIRANHGHELQINSHLVNDVRIQLGWLIGIVKRRAKELNHSHIVFKDCLYNLKTFEKVPFNRNIYASHYLPYKTSDFKMEIPVFKKFLDTSLIIKNEGIPDVDLIRLVQYMFGFFLIEDLRAGAAFFLVGDGANGKSVMATVIQEMVGARYCSAMSIQSLTTDKFAVQHLVGKKLNVSNEEESKYLRSDKFKALITGEMVSAERKFGDSFEFLPRTKYLFATNQLPTFEGINYGIRRRIKIIPFHRIFMPLERDQSLIKKLRKELPGIIGWAIKGAKELVKNKFSFPESRQAKKAMEEFEDEISSAVRFIRENYNVDDKQWISNDSLYIDYKNWCDKVGKRAVNKYGFHRDVMSTIDGLKNVFRKDSYNKSMRCKNLILKDNISTDTTSEIDDEKLF